MMSKMIKGSGLNVTFENLNSQLHKVGATEIPNLIREIAKRVENDSSFRRYVLHTDKPFFYVLWAISLSI